MAPVAALDVFISFSRRDLGQADKICEALEAKGIQCWMAHRDIVPGGGYLGPVLEAADHCRAVVVILSSNTNSSGIYVLERAANRGVPIILVMIDHVMPPAEFERFEATALAIDVSAGPLESHLRSIAVQVNSLLNPNHRQEQHETSRTPADGQDLEHDTEGRSRDELALPEGHSAPLVDMQLNRIDEEAIEIALRTAAQVFSEMRGAAHDTAVTPRRAPRQALSLLAQSSEAAHPSPRPRPVDSKKEHVKRNFALVLVGLALIAFGVGVLFSGQITGLLNMIAEYIHHLGLS